MVAMAIKVLVLLGGDLDEELVPRYQQAEAAGMLSIVGYARLTEHGLAIDGMTGHAEVNRVLLSCSKLFVMLQALQHYAPKIPRTAMLDGRIFRMPGLDVPRLFAENIGYAPLAANPIDREENFSDLTRSELPRIWSYGQRKVSVGVKSYFSGYIEWGYRGSAQEIRIGNYTSFGGHVVFEIGMNNQHDYHRVTTYDPGCMDFDTNIWPSLRYKSSGGDTCRIGCMGWTWQPPKSGR